MPVKVKAKKRPEDSKNRPEGPGEYPSLSASDSASDYYTLFVYRPNWFVLSQTGGEPIKQEEIPAWDKQLALKALDIAEVPFEMTDGNCLGYARKREIAVSPLSPFHYKTLFHEIGHVELGHTAEANFQDGEYTPRNIREAEAESVALLCSESLGMEGSEYARGYLQHWLNGDKIPEKSAQKIFATTDRILKAGRKFTDPE